MYSKQHVRNTLPNVTLVGGYNCVKCGFPYEQINRENYSFILEHNCEAYLLERLDNYEKRIELLENTLHILREGEH